MELCLRSYGWAAPMRGDVSSSADSASGPRQSDVQLPGYCPPADVSCSTPSASAFKQAFSSEVINMSSGEGC